MLRFIKIVIYFNKLIVICTNRPRDPKVVDIYVVGTIEKYSKAMLKIILWCVSKRSVPNMVSLSRYQGSD